MSFSKLHTSDFSNILSKSFVKSWSYAYSKHCVYLQNNTVYIVAVVDMDVDFFLRSIMIPITF